MQPKMPIQVFFMKKAINELLEREVIDENKATELWEGYRTARRKDDEVSCMQQTYV